MATCVIWRSLSKYSNLTTKVCCRCMSGAANNVQVEKQYMNFYNYLKYVHERLSDRKTKWPPSLLEILGNNAKLSWQNLESTVEAIAMLEKTIENYHEVDALMSDAATETNQNEKDDLIAIAEDEKSEILGEIQKRNGNIIDNFQELMHRGTVTSNVVLEVSAGVGGQEAMLFAAELFDMYDSFCLNFGQTFEILQIQQSDIGGYVKASANVYFNDAEFYSFLHNENGTHRVQRVPATEKSGRIHTSTASVAILPVFVNQSIVIEGKDIEIHRLKKSNSPGGQHANKTESAVRIKHIPSGKIVESNVSRSQDENKELALKLLKAKLLAEKVEKEESALMKARRQQIRNRERSDKIRTYNFNRDRVTDHRIGFSVQNVSKFMSGDTSLLKLMNKLNENQELEELNLAINVLLAEGKKLFHFDG